MAGSAGKNTNGGSQSEGGRPTSGGAGGGEGGGVVIGGTKGEGGTPPIEGGMGGEGGASGSANGGAGGADPTDPLEGVLLNELKGQGDGPDFIELFNTNETALDLGGYYVGDDGNNRVTFPVGASIAAHGFVVVRLQQPIPSPQVTTCYDNFTPCYDGIWGISSSSGENIYLRNPKNVALDTLHYPAVTAVDKLLDGQSLGRFPDGTEAIGAVTVSPGVANTQPL